MELVAELKGRDGQTRTVRVPCPVVEGEGGQLRSVRQGLVELQQRVVELLAPLVQEEREAAAADGGKRGVVEDEDDDDNNEDESEDENNIEPNASTDDPPPKRTKVQQP
ncbi:EKC/KEOPS complex subunit GON7-like [Pogoniulus pusillus]|uniref:EKC/KEOPS complex subunit GON7-like n=1 Tax=Pogoniulus pusillus TaxID=488313 RepID=UPI0030B990A7